MNKFLYIFSVVLCLISCDTQTKYDGSIVVEINGVKLSKTEVLSTLPTNISSADSTRMVDEYVENWVKRRLLLQKAELNIGNNAEIRVLIDKYKEQLLIENYLQVLVEQKAEIEATEEQISAFYEENKEHYNLSENLAKGIFVVVPIDASNKDVLKTLLKDEIIDKTAIEVYCLQNAAKVDFFTEDWVPFRLIKQHLPETNTNESQVLKSKIFYEVDDSLFHYILKIDEYKLEGDTPPLNYIKTELEEYLLNTNKVTYLQKMEEDLYEDAKRKGIIQYNH